MHRTLSYALGVLAGVLVTGPAAAAVIEGRVIEIPDGATLTVLSSKGSSIHRIRLAGIDAPNFDHVAGGSARASLRRLARGKSVRIETNAIDSNGALVGLVLIHAAADCTKPPCQDNVDPALVQLQTGHAWTEQTGLLHQVAELQKRYAEAETHAKTKRLGLWRDYWVTPGGALRTRQAMRLSPVRRQ